MRQFWRKYPGLAVATPGMLLFLFWAAAPRSLTAPEWMVNVCIFFWCLMMVGIAYEAQIDRARVIWPKVRKAFFGGDRTE